jgi:hypothetical protein
MAASRDREPTDLAKLQTITVKTANRSVCVENHQHCQVSLTLLATKDVSAGPIHHELIHAGLHR